MNYYAAKFAREKKKHPVEWIIKSVKGRFVLVHVGGVKSVK